MPNSTPKLLLIVGFVALLGSSTAIARQGPNIVFIMADDLGYGDVGCYGSQKNETPNIDRLAAGGLRCRDFHSNGPMCSPTRAALLTGCYQQRFGRRFENALSPGRSRELGLPLEAVTLAEVLKSSRYVTGMFGKWHLGYKPPLMPADQGFDEFRGLVSGDGDHHTQIDRSGNQDWWENNDISMERGYTTDLVTNHSVDFIQRHRSHPFFLYVLIWLSISPGKAPMIRRTASKERTTPMTSGGLCPIGRMWRLMSRRWSRPSIEASAASFRSWTICSSRRAH